jgi:ComF family protein
VIFLEPPWPHLLDDISPLQDIHAAARLAGPLRKATHQFKYGGLRVLAPLLGQMLFDCWSSDPLPVQVIVPVPLHSSRLRERGYNQSALLAHELAKHTGLPVSENALVRLTPTPPQVGLNAVERARNVRGAFSCINGELRGCQVLLVDDVLTTGATVRTCAEELLRAGSGNVWGLTLARD